VKKLKLAAPGQARRASTADYPLRPLFPDSGLDSHTQISPLNRLDNSASDLLEFLLPLRQIKPFAEHGMRRELHKLGSEICMPITRRAHQQSIPGLVAVADRKAEQAIYISRFEAE
jgi:hypothetical protein